MASDARCRATASSSRPVRGKTCLATRSIEQLPRLFYRRAHGLVLWIVPSDAIYTQTWKTLANREHPYRMTLERASGGRVKLLRRGDAFSKADVENYLCVLGMMMAAAARKETEVLKMFQDSGRYPGFFPDEDNFEAQRELLQMAPNLETLDLAEGAWGGGPSVKQSLGNMLCLTRPTVILDEGHATYTANRRATLAAAMVAAAMVAAAMVAAVARSRPCVTSTRMPGLRSARVAFSPLTVMLVVVVR